MTMASKKKPVVDFGSLLTGIIIKTFERLENEFEEWSRRAAREAKDYKDKTVEYNIRESKKREKQLEKLREQIEGWLRETGLSHRSRLAEIQEKLDRMENKLGKLEKRSSGKKE